MDALVAICLILAAGAIRRLGGAVYKVGDSAGWTTIGNVDYKKWAATKTFNVGDVIVFEYNPQFHNVMQVTHAGYRACNSSSPIATHTTGNDSITITTRRHHFFLCGVPGHCQAGQKVDINAHRHPHSVALAPVQVPSTVIGPPITPSAATTTQNLHLLQLILQLLIVFLIRS